MRFTTHINNQRCLEWGLTANQGALFDFLNQASSWAEAIIFNDVVYYWVSKNKVIDELPLFYQKRDTVYRHLKLLEKKGLILYVKDDKDEKDPTKQKDLIKLTEKGKTWNEFSTDFDPKKLELNRGTLGSRSEPPRISIRTPSDLDPTYNNINNNTINIKRERARDLSKYLFESIKQINPSFDKNIKHDLERWTNTIVKICSDEKDNVQHIKSVIDWALQDKHWRCVLVNTYAAEKLVQHWGQVEFRAQNHEAKNSKTKNTGVTINSQLPILKDLVCKYFKLRNKNKDQQINADDFSSKFEYWLIRETAEEARIRIASDFEIEKLAKNEIERMSKLLAKGMTIPEINETEMNIFKG